MDVENVEKTLREAMRIRDLIETDLDESRRVLARKQFEHDRALRRWSAACAEVSRWQQIREGLRRPRVVAP